MEVQIERIQRDLDAMNAFTVPSGAVHDSSVLAEMTDVGMIFVPSHGGRSHCPEEFTEFRDIQVGANLLLSSLMEVAA